LSDPTIIIIGAGAAGLVAAQELERAGHAPLLLDAADRVGGRLRTDEVEGFRLDRGFQVLLTEYPEVKRYLDLGALQLGKFRPCGSLLRSFAPRFPRSAPFRTRSNSDSWE